METEKQIESYFRKEVERIGGKSFKFTSPSHRGVADRIACLPNGQTWFVELKTPTGRLSELQKIFAADMARLGQLYVCLWSKGDVDAFTNSLHNAAH